MPHDRSAALEVLPTLAPPYDMIFIDADKESGTVRLFQALEPNRRVDCTRLQLVGAKGWDGMAIARLR